MIKLPLDNRDRRWIADDGESWRVIFAHLPAAPGFQRSTATYGNENGARAAYKVLRRDVNTPVIAVVYATEASTHWTFVDTTGWEGNG